MRLVEPIVSFINVTRRYGEHIVLDVEDDEIKIAHRHATTQLLREDGIPNGSAKEPHSSRSREALGNCRDVGHHTFTFEDTCERFEHHTTVQCRGRSRPHGGSVQVVSQKM